MKSDIILGGGLAGLIWASLNENCILIEPRDLGGMVTNDSGPFIIHYSPELEKFFEYLGITPDIRTFSCGFYRMGEEKIHAKPPEGFRGDYYRFSRRFYSDHPIPESVMNGDKNFFKGFDISGKEFTEACIQKAYDMGTIFIRDRVTRIFQNTLIDGQAIELADRDILRTKTFGRRIVCTIPRMILEQLTEPDTVLEAGDYLSKGFWKVPEKELDKNLVEALKAYDFVYCCPVQPPFTRDYSIPTRMTYSNGYVIMEYTFDGDLNLSLIQEHMKKTAPKVGGSPNIMFRSIVRVNRPLHEYKGMRFLGRASVWDHSIKIGDVIKEAWNAKKR